jgi:hypothetical protein
VTVRVTGTLVLPPPEDAVTVTFDVLAGVPVAGDVPPVLLAGGLESLLLQLNMPTSVSAATNPTAILNSRPCEP